MPGMKRRGLFEGLIFVAFGALVPTARAQSSRSRAVTVTRLVKIFLDEESRLLDALEKKDRAALEGLLAEFFEMRVASRPGTPIPRAEWLSAALSADAPNVADYLVEQMAVQEMGTQAIASFLLQAADPARKGAPPSVFVVDTWERVGDGWRLRVRYAAPVATRAARVSGEAVVETIPKKY
jgi:hypothetical protein